MKFVYFGYDFSLPSLKRLVDDGNELIALFTFPCDNVFNFNKSITAFGTKQGVPVHIKPPKPKEIQELIDKGAEFFLSAGYPYKIPPIDEKKAYGLNCHPTYLPMGRGLMPTPIILLEEPDAGGFTVHKLTPEFDAGDILYQEKIEVNDETTVDSYSEDIAKRSPQALSKIIANLEETWTNAAPQDHNKASVFKQPDDAMRTLHWHRSARDLDRILRAFGTFGSLSHINGRTHAIFKHRTIFEPHAYEPGMVVEATDDYKKIAVGKTPED
ncbi:MAG: formyltransferase family protein, partial [Pseudomonadota bacterium]